MYRCSKSELFQEYSAILRTLDDMDCNMKRKSCSFDSGDYKTSYEPKFSSFEKMEPMRESSTKCIEENEPPESYQIIEVYALILSTASFIIGLSLSMTYKVLDFFVDLSRSLIRMCLDDMFGDEPFLLTYSNIKGMFANLSIRKVLLFGELVLVSMSYLIAYFLYHMIRLLLIQISVK